MTVILEKPTPEVEERPKAPWRLRSRLGSRRDRWITGGLLLVVLVVQGLNITGYPAVGDDEGTYLAQAWALQTGHGLAPYTYWYDHPPLGWIQIAAVSWLPGLVLPAHLAVANARVVMLLVTLVAVALVDGIGRRMGLPRWAAALGALLFALSPLAVTLQREIYLDNLAVVWMLGAFALALSPRKHLWHHVAAGCCAAVSILSKETMVVVLPALILALWQGSHPTTRTFSVAGFFSVLGLTGTIYPLYAFLNGELLPGADHVSLVGGVLFQLQRQGSPSFLDPTSSSRAVVSSWLYYDTVLIVAGLVAAAVALVAVRRLRAPALAVVLLLGMALRPGYLPAMYVIQALPFLALCTAGVAAVAVRVVLTRGPGVTGRWRWARIGVVALAGAAGLAYVGPRWVAGDVTAMTQDDNAANRQAVAALAALPHDTQTKVLVDDALWLDLVHEGYQPGHGAIWFYKVDLDPAVHPAGGWRDLDYVVSTPIVRESVTGLPTVIDAIAHSTVVRTFGSGDARIEIRHIEGKP